MPFSQPHLLFTCSFPSRKLLKNLILKISALGLYCWCFSGHLLGVHTQTSPTWKYGGVNVMYRGIWTSGSWKPVWKCPHLPCLSPSLDSWSWNEAGPLGKSSQICSNSSIWQHLLENVYSCYLFPFASFTPLNLLLLFPKVVCPLKIVSHNLLVWHSHFWGSQVHFLLILRLPEFSSTFPMDYSCTPPCWSKSYSFLKIGLTYYLLQDHFPMMPRMTFLLSETSISQFKEHSSLSLRRKTLRWPCKLIFFANA